MDTDQLKKWFTNKNNYLRVAGGLCVSLGAFLHAGMPALIFMVGLILFLSTDD